MRKKNDFSVLIDKNCVLWSKWIALTSTTNYSIPWSLFYLPVKSFCTYSLSPRIPPNSLTPTFPPPAFGILLNRWRMLFCSHKCHCERTVSPHRWQDSYALFRPLLQCTVHTVYSTIHRGICLSMYLRGGGGRERLGFFSRCILNSKLSL